MSRRQETTNKLPHLAAKITYLSRGKHTRQGNKPGIAKRCTTCHFSKCRC